MEHPGPLKKKDRKSFYGDKWETKLFKKGVPGTLYAFFRSCWEQHRGGTAGEANSSVFADPFKTFSRQRHMFEWADDLGRGREGGERLRYFAFEVSTASGSSRRGFLATTLRRFWRHYSVMPSCSRHYYELIRENEPCSMYYDLEFSKALNEGRAESGDRIVDLVISLVSHHSPPLPPANPRTHALKHARTNKTHTHRERSPAPSDGSFCPPSHQTRDELRERFGVDLIAGAVELDSSTDKKWSRHLILHLGGGSTLASNAHAGQIASSVCSRILEKVGEGCPRHRELMVVGSGGVEAPLIDVSVYSRNRTFRIWRSSKCGKGVELLPTPRFLGGTFLKDAALRKSGVERRFFEDSLVTGRAAGGEGARLSCEEVDAGTRGGLVGLSGNKVHQRTPRCAPCRPEEGEGPLLRYPKLCRFLCDSESPDGRPLGRLRSHVHFVESGTIIINLAENRYCSRVGRQHKVSPGLARLTALLTRHSPPPLSPSVQRSLPCGGLQVGPVVPEVL